MSKTGYLAVMAVTLMLAGYAAEATPSTTYWTPSSIDIQPYGVVHLGVDNYFTAGRKTSDGGGSFPTDVGLTVGVLPLESLQMEVGVDVFESSDYPLYFNAKIGFPENVLFSGAPAFQAGICNAGAEKDVTDQNIFFAVIGRSIAGAGRLSCGFYSGNPDVLVNKDGEEENTGFMAAFDRGFLPARDSEGEYNKLVLAADYASGKNAFGAGGAGLSWFFTRNVSVLAGPVWFNEKAINGETKWTIQLDINM